MNRPIYVYEVTFQILYKDGRKELKTVVQHAYSVMDACTQGIYVVSSEDVEKISVKEIGPPAADIRAQEHELARALETAVDKIIRDRTSIDIHVPGRTYTDAVATSGSKATVARKI